MKSKQTQIDASADAFTARLAEWSTAVDGAWRRPDELADDFAALNVRLVGGSASAKVEAARQLGQHGALAVAPLCAALRDPDYQVRSAAAVSLAELGNERAIGPLAEALRNCFERRSARWSLLLGIGSVIGMGMLLLLLLVVSVMARSGIGLSDWWEAVCAWGKRRSGKTELIRVLADALLQLGERTESPELRRVLPDLKIVAVDVIRHGSRTRETSRAAVARIEALTARLRDLPLPATGDTLRSETLPYPSQPSETSPPKVESRKA